MGRGSDGGTARRTFAVGETVALGGFEVLSTTQEAFARELFAALAGGQARQVLFANTNFVVQCQPLRERLRVPTLRIVNDGIGMDLAARWLHGRRFPGNLNGTDLVPWLCAHSPQPLRFFLLGGRPGVAEAAAAVLRGGDGEAGAGTCEG